MILLKILSLLIWLVFLPFCMGVIVSAGLRREDINAGSIFISGYLTEFALFELIGIPVAILVIYHSFSLLSYLFAGMSILLAAGGILLLYKKRQNGADSIKNETGAGYGIMPGRKSFLQQYRWEEKLYFGIFLLLVGFQLYMAFTRASFDGDDAYYGAQGLIAVQHDTLYRINPYTGRSMPLDMRHAMALIPVWEAFVGKMSGIHPTIIAHSVIPLIFLPLTYLVYFQIGKKLFSDKEGKPSGMLPVFMILIALFQMFGNVSIYTNETFLLTRTWQGKSLAGNFMIPAVFWLFLCLFDRDGTEDGTNKTDEATDKITGEMKNATTDKKQEKSCENGYFLLLGVLTLAAGISSSLAVLLCLLLVAGLTVLAALKERRFLLLIKGALSCLPGALYIITYLIVSH